MAKINIGEGNWADIRAKINTMLTELYTSSGSGSPTYTIGEGDWGTTRTHINSMYQELVLAMTSTTTSAPTTTSVSTTTSAPTTTMIYTLSDGVIYFLPLDESSGVTANDSVSNKDFTLTGGTWAQPGVAMDGDQDYLYRAYDDGIATLGTEFTASIWVTFDSVTGSHSLFAQNNDVSPYRTWDIHTNGTEVRFAVDTTGGSVESQTKSGIFDLQTGVLYHIVGRYNGTELKIYVNNIDRTYSSPQSLTGSVVHGTSGMYHGVYDGSAYDLDGTVKSIGLWNRALGTSEITELYNSGAPLNYPFAAPTTTAAPDAYSAEYQAVYNAMTNKPSTSVASAQNTMVESLVSAGIWSKLDLFYLLANTTEQAALLNWINPTGSFNLINVHSTLFTTLEGFTGDGANDYLNTNYNPTTNASQFSINSSSFGCYLRLTNDDSEIYDICTYAGSGKHLSLISSYGGALYVGINGDTDANKGVSSAVGFSIATRTSSTNIRLYKNGSFIQQSTSNVIGLPNTTTILLARPGTKYSSNQMSAMFIGNVLSDSEVTILNNAIETYMDYNGKGVIA